MLWEGPFSSRELRLKALGRGLPGFLGTPRRGARALGGTCLGGWIVGAGVGAAPRSVNPPQDLLPAAPSHLPCVPLQSHRSPRKVLHRSGAQSKHPAGRLCELGEPQYPRDARGDRLCPASGRP